MSSISDVISVIEPSTCLYVSVANNNTIILDAWKQKILMRAHLM